MFKKIKHMLRKDYTKTETMGIFAILFAIGLLIDMFFNRNTLVSILIAGCLIFLGYRWRKRGRTIFGTIFLFIGLFVFLTNVLTSAIFFIIAACLLIYFGFRLFKSSNDPHEVEISFDRGSTQYNDVVQVDSFFKNSFFGKKQKAEDVYVLEDINIQYGLGDMQYDFSYAIIPEGETVILIRGIAGSVRLFVPYDLDVSLHCSSVYGKMNLLGHEQAGFNKTCKFQTRDYQQATRKIKIVASVLVGDIEVRNV